MMLSKIRSEARALNDLFWNRAKKINAYYVCCFWLDPVTGCLNNRKGYFDDINEAQAFAMMLKETYENYEVPYYISSNASECKYDGALFDEAV